MALLIGLLLLGVLLLPIARGLGLAGELFRVRAQYGALTLERGRLPPKLFAELSDIAVRERLHDVIVRAVVEGGRPRLILQGKTGHSAEQPLRNVLGRFTLAQLRSGSLRAK
jgi:hypothetical protein